MLNPAALADRVAARFHPLPVAVLLYVDALALAIDYEDIVEVAGVLRLSGREILYELLKVLPTPNTEGKNWVLHEIREALAV